MDSLDIGVADALPNCEFYIGKSLPFYSPSSSANSDFSHIHARKSGQQQRAFQKAVFEERAGATEIFPY
jgi:hypothetical protein